MSLYIVDIHGELEGDYEIIRKYEEPTTKNDSGVDYISKVDAIHLADKLKNDLPDDERIADMVMAHNEGILEYQTELSLLPSVTPQEPKSEWEQDHAILKAYSDGANEVLEKIRFDLFKLYNDRPSDYNHSQRTELFCEVIKILDKYTAESAHDVAQAIVKNNGVVDL